MPSKPKLNMILGRTGKPNMKTLPLPGIWGGSVLNLGCDDGCTAINIIEFVE